MPSACLPPPRAAAIRWREPSLVTLINAGAGNARGMVAACVSRDFAGALTHLRGTMARRREVVREDLRQRVTSGLHLGQLCPGDRLGSARQTAREVGTDYRMVVAALRGLERDGLLEIRPRGGIYVGRRTSPPRSSRLAGFGDRL